jgi:hypothetical protein
MEKAKQTAETVIHESAISRIEPVPEIPTELYPPAEPSWDRARAYVSDVRRSIMAVIHLGVEIRALQVQYYAQGERTDMHSKPSANVSKGWQQKVQDELGVSHMTAYRIIERAESLVCMRRIEIGEAVSYYDNRSNSQRTLEPTPKLQQQASKAIESVVAGSVAAPRAWAGLIGEGSRISSQGGSASRAAVDHARNLKSAIVKLRNSLKEWKYIDGRDRIEIEEMWKEIAAILPSTMTLEYISEC